MNAYEQLKQIMLDQISDCRKKKQYIIVMKNQALLNYYVGQIKAYENVISIISGSQPAADLYEAAALEIESEQDKLLV